MLLRRRPSGAHPGRLRHPTRPQRLRLDRAHPARRHRHRNRRHLGAGLARRRGSFGPAVRATASSVWRLQHCQWWARDEVEWLDEVETHEARDIGTEVHELIAHWVTNGETPAPDCDPRAERMASAAMAWIRDHVDDDCPGAEIGFVLSSPVDPLASIVKGRDYGDGPRFMAGAVDLLWSESGHRHVLDWKTGRRENVQPIGRNDQMRTLAMLLDKAVGAGEVTTHLVFLGGDDVEHESATLDEFDIAEHEAWLREVDAAIPTSLPQPGKHCEYCPARANCPATREAVLAIADEALPDRRRLPLVTDPGKFESPEHAAEQYALVRAAEALLAALKSAVVAFADRYDGIPLPNGSTYQRTTRKVEKIDLDVPGAKNVLRDFLGERWIDAVEVSTTKAALATQCKPIAVREKKAQKVVNADLLSRLKAVGAVKSSMQVTYKEVPAHDAHGIPEMP